MAESRTTTAVVPLNGSNYPTWKVQCKMALMKEGLWRIVTGEEVAPGDSASEQAKFAARKDRALATIVLSVDTSLLYLIRDPQDPVVVWRKLAGQFEKKTWATRLDLRRKLHSLQLKDGQSAQAHIKVMTELFDSLAVAGEDVSEEDRVVYLLASLPESYNVLVTALEANEDVPKFEVVTERILHQERKSKEKGQNGEGVLITHRYFKAKPKKCHYCGRMGHIKKFCRDFKAEKEHQKGDKKEKSHKATTVTTCEESDSESSGLIASHALAVVSSTEDYTWIVDSGATCHMCHTKRMFNTLYQIEKPIDVTLGDGRTLTAIGRGKVVLDMVLPNGELKSCKLHDVLYVPKLTYNLISVTRASQTGKTVKFTKHACYVLDKNHKAVAKATKVGSLYQLDHKINCEHTSIVEKSETKEDIWHKRYGHLGVSSLQKLAHKNMVDGFDFDPNGEITFCEVCPQGKQHRTRFFSSSNRADELLGLVHSDVCGKMNEKSLGGAEYFLTFIDDKSRYVWVYCLQRKSQVFEKFCDWKAMVEKATGKKLKAIRTDNGGEFTSSEFEVHLRAEGVRHELIIPKNPEQNGVAERMNRILVETVRSMLCHANLSHRFWGEALSTAAYLRNRSPTKAVSEMTPYEAWTGEKPQVDHLRIFGCQGFVHIPKDERKKLDPKSRKCIFMGYGTTTKGYRLYDPLKQKVIYSRDVMFNELKCGLEESTQREPQKYVHLECTDDPLEMADPPEPLPESPQPWRHSERERKQTEFYGHRCNVTDITEPTSVNEAQADHRWADAMRHEIDSLDDNNVWELVELPAGRKTVGSKWVFKLKKNADGSIERCKARLVAQGYSQKEGLDYDETFSPVVRSESVRTVIALAAMNGLTLHQMDITTAFLHGNLAEEVYMKQPEGFLVEGQEHLVCRLKKSIYGLKQAPRCWNQALDAKLKTMGFSQSSSDPCIYISTTDSLLILAVYVDDILLAGKSQTRITQVKTELGKSFRVKDLGELHYFLGVNVKQNSDGGNIWIGQPSYTQEVLKKFRLEHCKPAATPVAQGTKLLKATDDSEHFDATLYKSAVGMLLYLSGWTRPDIAFAVSNVARFCSRPTKEHWVAVKRILKYLKGTANYGLLYIKKDDANRVIVGFSDADWAGDANDRKSTSGYLFMVSGAPVSWKSKKQTCVALSTAEAEYVALTAATQEITWLRQLLKDLHNEQVKPTVIHEDNQSAICIAQNTQYHGKTKHIDIKYHFVREKVSDRTVELRYCPTSDMLADMLTKGLTRDKFTQLRNLTGMREMIVYE